MFSITERRYEKILKAIEEATTLKEKEKETRRKERHGEIYQLSEEEKKKTGHQRFLVECKECSSWCKRNGRKCIMWPVTSEGKLCPLCQECLLIRVSII